MTGSGTRKGTVYLVGAGPGDPGLLTVRGAACLRSADVVLIDYLASDALLDHAGGHAEIISLGRSGEGRRYSQQEIVELMLDRAGRGLNVVRLKGGDPSIFGRGAEEAEQLREAGIPYQIVPGITTAQAVAAYAEIPLTHREEASAVAFVTGRERPDRDEPAIDYAALATFPGTLVIYMGVGTVAEWSGALMRAGKSPATPVGIVRWASRRNQETYRSTLEKVAGVVTETGIEAPAVFIIGPAVDRTPESVWFTSESTVEPEDD